ncbi:MAG: hypothetical protein JW976_09720 [Syntrophaceae bacterium]|nr:hypothetical protein [Syntrophaceae bacterium]
MPKPEYVLLYVFCAGVFLQSLWYLRNRSQLAWAFVIALACLAPAWFIPEAKYRSLAGPLCWTLFYAIVFSVAFRKHMLPAVTALVLLLYSALLYYLLYLLMKDSGVAMPRSVIIGALVPGVLIVLTVLAGLLRFKPVRVLCYLWYLIALCVMISCQWSLDNFTEQYGGHAFSPALFLYVFLAGGVFLFFISNLVQMFLVIPFPERASHRIIFEALFGSVSYAKEQSSNMSDRLGKRRVSVKGWILFAAYIAFLSANAKLGLIDHGLVINLSIIVIFYFLMPRNREIFGDAKQTAETKGSKEP